MPSAKILEAKKALVADLNEKIAGSLAGVVVAYNGISVADDTKLRKELREAGVHYMVGNVLIWKRTGMMRNLWQCMSNTRPLMSWKSSSWIWKSR